MFRQQAMKKASTPGEKLDELTRVTSPRSWLALAGLLAVVGAMVVYGVFGTSASTVEGLGVLLPAGGAHGGLGVIAAPDGGMVDDVFIETQAHVEPEARIAVIRDGAGELVEITAPEELIITERLVKPGWYVQQGDRMFSYEPAVDGEHTDQEARVFLPAGAGKAVQPGMTIHISPDFTPSEQYGSIVGEVTKVSEFPVSPERIDLLVQDAALVDLFLSQGPVLEIQASLETADTPSGFRWTAGSGPDFEIGHGSLIHASVVLSTSAPAEKVLGG